MFIIYYLLALSTSIILLIWLLKLKKNDPYPKGFVLGMLAWGAWTAVLVGVIFAALDYAPLIRSVGVERFFELFLADDPAVLENSVKEVAGYGEYLSFSSIMWENFLSAAIPEEIAKYLVAIAYIKRLDSRNIVFDAVICSSIVGIGFQILEDMIFCTDLSTAIIRGLVPFHFTYGAIMGFFISRAIIKNKKKYHFLALFVPSLIHGIYDFSIYLVDASDWFLLGFVIIYVAMVVLTFFILSRIKKMSKALQPPAQSVPLA